MTVLILCIAVVALDQLTKALVIARFALGEKLTVVPGFFDLTYVRNTGAAWGILAGHGTWLIGLSLIMLIVIIRYRRSFLGEGLASRVAMACMLGGIIGNLIDRIKLTFVVDFLDFHWFEGYHFPAFNVADSAICIGVGLYILCQFRMARSEARAAGGDGSPVQVSVVDSP